MKMFVLGILALLVFGTTTFAQQPISNYSQNFNNLVGNTLPADWKVTRAPANYRFVTPWNATPGQTALVVDQVVTGYPINPGNDQTFSCYETHASPNDANDRAIGMRQNPSAYSQSLMVRLYNDMPGPLTEVSIEYMVEKYKNGSNQDGTTIRCYYTSNPDPASFSETHTDYTTGWVGAQTTPNTNTAPYEYHYLTDGTNSDPANSLYSMNFPTPNQGIVRQIQTATISGLNVPPNANFYIAINISIGDPTNQGGNNAQNSQIFAIDDFSITGALPVELTSFTANRTSTDIQLKWRTATEKNNFGFDVERSFDGNEWENIGFVEGNGTVDSPREYSFVDATRMDGRQVVSYRLRQIDRDGTTDYSEVVRVALDGDGAFTLANFPNPFNPTTTIHFSLQQSSPVTLTVRDISGREVARLVDNASFDAGTHSVAFDAKGLPSGVYFSVLNTGTRLITSKMVVSK